MGLRKWERRGQGKAELQHCGSGEPHGHRTVITGPCPLWVTCTQSVHSAMPTVGHWEGMLLGHLPWSLSKGLPVDSLLLLQSCVECQRDEFG